MWDFLYSKKTRSFLYQVITVLLIGYFAWSIFQNTLNNVEERGITTGFSFLKDSSGFGIVQSLIEYDETSSYGRAFVVGLLNTILIAFLGVIFATILGFIVGISKLSKNFLLSKLATWYVELFRNVPLLLQIFFWYHAVLKPLSSPRDIYEKGETILFGINNRGIYLPKIQPEAGVSYFFYSILLAFIIIFFLSRYGAKLKHETGKEIPVFYSSLAILFGLPAIVLFLTSFFGNGIPFSAHYAQMSTFQLQGGFVIIPEFTSLLLALSIYTASFIAEIVRSGIQAVSYGQTEAAYSLGLPPSKTLRFIIIPQALRVIIPPLTSQYLNLTKNSSLAAAIAYPDIVSVFTGTVLNQTGQAIEVIAITMAIYLLISLVTSFFLNWYNKKIAIQER